MRKRREEGREGGKEKESKLTFRHELGRILDDISKVLFQHLLALGFVHLEGEGRGRKWREGGGRRRKGLRSTSTSRPLKAHHHLFVVKEAETRQILSVGFLS